MTHCHHLLRALAGPLLAGAVLGCGPGGSGAQGDSTGSQATTLTGSTDDPGATSTTAAFDVSWAIGEFFWPESDSEPVQTYSTMVIEANGTAIATTFNCLSGTEPVDVSMLSWEANSGELIAFVPPGPGQPIDLSTEDPDDLFVAPGAKADTIRIFSSKQDSGGPFYGLFERGRPCGEFSDGDLCGFHFYVHRCLE